MKRTIEDLEKLQREFLRPGEAAEFLGISKSTFYRYSKEFPFRLERIGKRIFVPKQAFLEFLKRR